MRVDDNERESRNAEPKESSFIAGFCLGAILTAMLVFIVLSFAGCTTTEHEDGTRTTSFDAEAFGTVVKAGGEVYDRYRATPMPSYYPPPAPMVNPYNGQVFYPYGR